jgi:hypothetical protein
MDWLSRLIGTSQASRKTAPRPPANDPQARLVKFRKVYNTVLQLINRPRDPSNEAPLLSELHSCLERIAAILRDETRAPVPHSCIQFASTSQLYAVIARAATASQYEPVIRSAVATFAALIDSEEEDFVSSAPFAKSLMRLIRRVVDSGSVLIGMDTETAILELLFTISAKIRLQPEILPVWFQSSVKQELEEMVLKEKNNFVGVTQKDDFPLCYLLIDRVHHEGRIGDFARTGLLYIFEATGRSTELEAWIVQSDLPTLMASGLGALYSQLSRELSILHPDATLPAVLAMSDYTTTHTRAAAESAFSERHKAHMTTFLSYLAFWQDILDHSRSADVKQTLLDHFQILFLQQLLYPSLLQSSDTDGGSSVAVLTYLQAALESLEYPDLVHMILTYLLAIPNAKSADLSSSTATMSLLKPPAQATLKPPSKASLNPISQATLTRRKSLMTLNPPKETNDGVEPILFNLFDLIVNSICSENSQTAFSALKLTSTIISRQRKYALGTLLKTQNVKSSDPSRSIGALEVELEHYSLLATSLHPQLGLESTYVGLCEDVRHNIEAQVATHATNATLERSFVDPQAYIGEYLLDSEDSLFKSMSSTLGTFFTNSVDVNLALTQAFISMALCIEIRLDGWAAISPSLYSASEEATSASRPWQSFLDSEEEHAWLALKRASHRPAWTDHSSPALFRVLEQLATELEDVREKIKNLDQLIAVRKTMLQASNLDILASEPPSLMNSPVQGSFLEVPGQFLSSSRSSSRARGRDGLDASNSRTTSPNPAARRRDESRGSSRSPGPRSNVFRPPPPDNPSTTDVLMQTISLPVNGLPDPEHKDRGVRSASLNHVLTNIVVLQEFILELTAVLQVRAAVLGPREVQSVV